MSNQIGSLKMGQKYKKTPAGEIPVDWECAAVPDVCDVLGGGTPDRTNPKYWDGEIFWATPTDVTAVNGDTISQTKGTISELGLKDSSANLMPSGSVLMTSRATLGYAVINTVPMATNQGFINFKCSVSLHNYFLMYYLRFKAAELERLAAGSTFLEIPKSTLKSFFVPIPSLKEQQQIAEVVTGVESLCAKVRAELEKTKELKKGLMRQLLTRGIGHKKFKKTPIGVIPVEWKVCKILEVCSIGPSKTELSVQVDIDVSFLRMEYVKEDAGGIAETETKKLKDIGNGYTYFRDGDVLFAKITPCMENGKIAIARNLKNSIGFGSTEFHVLRVNLQKMLPQYLFSWISRKEFRELATRYFRGSAGQQRVQRGFFEEADIPVPTLKEQEEISSVFLEMDVDLATKQALLESYLELKKGLMAILLTGKVRVQQHNTINPKG